MHTTTEIKDAVLHFLSRRDNVSATLATIGTDGVPHAAAMYFYVAEDFTFNFLTATDTRKYKNLMENPNASLVVGCGPEYVTVQAHGVATLLPKASEAENYAIANIKQRLVENDLTWPIFQLSEYDDNAIAVFSFTPSSLFLLNLESDNGLPLCTEGMLRVI